MISLQTVDHDDTFLQKLQLLYIFYITVAVQRVNGEHFTLGFGIGPFELSFTARMWNGTHE